MQYKIYGDSAYIVLDTAHIRARHSFHENTQREILENKVLASCRETIEWNYGDIGEEWPLLNYKKLLILRRMPVSDMFLVAMILRNAMNTIIANNTSKYFSLNPPTVETWLSQGPNARPHIVPSFDEQNDPGDEP